MFTTISSHKVAPLLQEAYDSIFRWTKSAGTQSVEYWITCRLWLTRDWEVVQKV